MTVITRILANKYRIVDNHIRTVGHHIMIHALVGVGIMLFIWALGLVVFDWMFGFLKDQEPFGQPLINMLISMVLVAFFSMLIFSNLIITLSTTYVSREVEYFMSLPLSMNQIFWAKLIETTVYSSWAFLVMSMPVFVAYGWALEAELVFYPALLLLLLPFIVIPAGLGSLITMVIAAFFPARRARTLAFVLGGLSIALTVLLIRMMGGRVVMSEGDNDFGSIMTMLSFGSRPYLPNVWLVKGMLAAADRRWDQYLYWFAMLASSALMIGQVCAWLVGPLYYRGWAMGRDTGSPPTRGRKKRSLFDRLDSVYGFLPRHLSALVGKDVRVFWRDPVQWSQLLILFGLLVIYVANIRFVVPKNEDSLMLTTYWKARLSLFNMGAACFILSILSTRFMYPMLSLEGKQYWIIGLAPMRRTTVVWQKYFLCWAGAAALTESIVLFSCWALQVDRQIFLISIVTILALSFGLTSLAIGLGAITPDFKEDNPARIANGLGGTVNVVLSLLYIGSVLSMVGALYLADKAGDHVSLRAWRWHIAATVLGLVAVNALAIVAPMWLGLRRWRRMEF